MFDNNQSNSQACATLRWLWWMNEWMNECNVQCACNCFTTKQSNFKGITSVQTGSIFLTISSKISLLSLHNSLWRPRLSTDDPHYVVSLFLFTVYCFIIHMSWLFYTIWTPKYCNIISILVTVIKSIDRLHGRKFIKS